jgi:hypothetical protein
MHVEEGRMNMAEKVSIELTDASDDGELAALGHLVSILERFNEERRQRMLNYLCERFPKIELILRDPKLEQGYAR